jgi:hypothetical protein
MEIEITNFCMGIKYEFNGQWKKMHLQLLKKVSSMLFPYFLANGLFNNILFVWTNSLVQKFTTESIASFENESFLFDRIIMAHFLHDPSSSYTLLPCPLLKIMGFTPIS